MDEMTHFNGLSPSEAERLAILMEEAGEAVQMAGKTLRHGYASKHPNEPPNSANDNRWRLTVEIADILAAVEMMSEAGDVDKESFPALIADKRHRMRPYLHHQAALSQGESS
jgi:NTP pyrophosphatase (non-canonical NTP hydrolase)